MPVPVEVTAELAPALPAPVLRSLARHLSLRAVTSGGAEFPSVRLERLLWQLMVQPGRSGHGRVRPWTRESGRLLDEARHIRRAEPTVPRRMRMRRLMRHLWRSVGGAPGSSQAVERGM